MSFNRFHVDGKLLGGAERWSVSWAVADGDGAGFNDPAVMTQQCDELMTFMSAGTGAGGDLRSLIGSTGTIDRVRCYFIPSPGQPADVAAESSAAAIAGSGAVTKPPQCSLAVSLLTGRPGRSYRGRFYWPALTQAMTADGKWGGTAIATLAADFRDLLVASADTGGTGTQKQRPVVASTVASALTTVSAVRVGSVIDTQRRRRDKMVETYASSVVP